MRFVVLSLVVFGCARGPGSSEPEPNADVLCVVGPESPACSVTLEATSGPPGTALQVDLTWDAGSAQLTEITVAAGVTLVTSPSVEEAAGAIRVVLYRVGPPKPLADADGVAFQAAFKADADSPVRGEGVVVTDADAVKLRVVFGDGVLQTRAAP